MPQSIGRALNSANDTTNQSGSRIHSFRLPFGRNWMSERQKG